MLNNEEIAMMEKSPSGSLCPYYYMGGELQPLKYGSYSIDKNRLFEVMKAEEKFVLALSGQHNRRIWVDLYDTQIDDEVICVLADHLKAIQQKIYKLCFVGCSLAEKRKITAQLMKNQVEIAEQVRYFSDPENAKQWLVGETF